MSGALQMIFPSHVLEGRTVLLGSELATALRCTDRHIRKAIGGDTPTELVDAGLGAIDIRGAGAQQPHWRFPIAYVDGWIVARTTGTTRRAALETMPVQSLRALADEIAAILKRRAAA